MPCRPFQNDALSLSGCARTFQMSVKDSHSVCLTNEFHLRLTVNRTCAFNRQISFGFRGMLRDVRREKYTHKFQHFDIEMKCEKILFAKNKNCLKMWERHIYRCALGRVTTDESKVN